MSRSDQYIGLNQRASEIVKGEPVLAYVEEVQRTFPDGHFERFDATPIYEMSVKREHHGSFDGAFGNSFELKEYIFPDGRVYAEYIQETIWSSGPMYFLALQDESENPIKESLWTEEEFQKYMQLDIGKML